MEKDTIELLRRFYELTYRQDNATAIVVSAELGEVDATIKEYQEKGYVLYDSNRFGAMGEGAMGEFLVFIKKK